MFNVAWCTKQTMTRVPEITYWEHFRPRTKCEKWVMNFNTLKPLSLFLCPCYSSSQAKHTSFPEKDFNIDNKTETLSLTWVHRLTTSKIFTLEVCHPWYSHDIEVCFIPRFRHRKGADMFCFQLQDFNSPHKNMCFSKMSLQNTCF